MSDWRKCTVWFCKRLVEQNESWRLEVELLRRWLSVSCRTSYRGTEPFLARSTCEQLRIHTMIFIDWNWPVESQWYICSSTITTGVDILPCFRNLICLFLCMTSSWWWPFHEWRSLFFLFCFFSDVSGSHVYALPMWRKNNGYLTK